MRPGAARASRQALACPPAASTVRPQRSRGPPPAIGGMTDVTDTKRKAADGTRPSDVLKPPAEKRDEGTVLDPEINLRDRSSFRPENEEEDV